MTPKLKSQQAPPPPPGSEITQLKRREEDIPYAKAAAFSPPIKLISAVAAFCFVVAAALILTRRFADRDQNPEPSADLNSCPETAQPSDFITGAGLTKSPDPLSLTPEEVREIINVALPAPFFGIQLRETLIYGYRSEGGGEPLLRNL